MANYYDDTGGAGVSTENAEVPSEAAPAETTEESESNVALLPKSFFPSDKPLEPGNVCQVRVEEVQDDQVIVSYEHSPSASEPEAGPETAPEPSDDMAAYMS